MKIGYYCESPADQAAMVVFTLGLLGEPPEPINMDLEAHSVPLSSAGRTVSSVEFTTIQMLKAWY
jgi:hypothetical protein